MILSCYAGLKARYELQTSGLLEEAQEIYDMPVCAEDVLRWLTQPDSFVLIGYDDDVPVGYVVFAVRTMEHGVRELFTLQTYNAGAKHHADVGLAALFTIAQKMNCARIGTMLPYDTAAVHCRRFGWTPSAVYATREVTPHVNQ
jgi:hypothetical protein